MQRKEKGMLRPFTERDCPAQAGLCSPSTERGTQCSLAHMCLRPVQVLPATLAPFGLPVLAAHLSPWHFLPRQVWQTVPRRPVEGSVFHGPAVRGHTVQPVLGSTAKRGMLRCRRGQALYEYILAFPVFALLLLFVGVFAWYWWNQSVAAVAIHDGVRAAAVYDGTPEDGLAVVEERLYAPLGAITSASYDGHYSIATFPQFRSVYGTIDKGTSVHIPFLNRSDPLLFRVRAFSFQRDWAFYGGPGNGWD